MKLTKNFKVWLPFDSSATKNLQGENWTAYGNATIGSANAFFKNALQLDGSSYIQSGEFELGGQDFTVDGWCYTDPSCVGGARVFNIHLTPDTGNSLVHLRHPYGNSKWRLATNTLARVGSNVNIQDSGVDPTGGLHHFAVVYQYAEKLMTFYVDGVRKARQTNCPQFTRKNFIVEVGVQFFSSTESYYFTGTVDEFRIYDGVALWKENFSPPNVDEYKFINIDFEFDAERRVKNPLLSWRYDNYGSADFLTVSGTTLQNLPKTKSKFGSAFYQTSHTKCFDIAATKEIWIKFDVFTTLANRWRAYNDATGSSSDGICSQTDGRLNFWVNNELAEEFSNYVKNRLQTYLLHMKSDSAKGILEVWQDGEKIYSYSGNLNNGDDFANIYLQSDGSGTFFSNVIISNDIIELNEDASLVGVLWTWNFDAERVISNRVLNAKMNTATKVLLHFDDDSDPYKDDCKNSWTSENNPAVSSENAKFGKALQLDSEDKTLTLDGKITLGGKDFSVAGWLYVPASETTHASGRKNRRIFSIGYLLNLGFYAIMNSSPWYMALNTWINANAAAQSDLSGYALNKGLNVGDRLLHFELDYDYSEKTMTFYIDGKEYVKRTNCPQYDRKEFSVKFGSCVATIDDFRIVDGYMLHTKNFIPPTAPYDISEKWIEFNSDIERRIFNKITKNFDVERLIFNKIEKYFDVERILKYKAELQNFYFDIERKLFAEVEIYFDTERKLPHYITDFSKNFQEIEIEIASQQLTDRLTLTTVKPMKILEQVKGVYLDYFFDVRIEETSERGILTTCQCCSDIDEILYTQFDYKIERDFVCYTIDYTTGKITNREVYPAAGWVLPDDVSGEIIAKAYASSHLKIISAAIGKELVMKFDDFVSDAEIEQENITYADLLSNLFGWTSRLPQMKINCYLRDDKLFAIQRGFESRIIDLTNTEHTMPTINKTLMRTTWGSAADSNFTATRHHGGWYVYPPPRKISDDGKTSYVYRRVHPHGYLLTSSRTQNDDGSYENVSYVYSDFPPYELVEEVHEKHEWDEENRRYLSGERTYTHHTHLTPSQNHTQSFDEDGNELAGVVGSHVAGFYDEKLTIEEPFDEQKEVTLEGNPLIDTSFPVADFEKLVELTDAIKWLNRKIQETVSFDVYNYPHVIDFNDRIIFNGNIYYLESNTVSKNSRTVNKQSVFFVRWYE